MKKFSTHLRKTDIIIIGILIAAAALISVFVYSGEKTSADFVIVEFLDGLDGPRSEKYSLAVDGEYLLKSNISHYELTLKIENGYAYVSEADCRGHDCMHQGKISRNGEAIVCIPSGIVITCKGENGGNEDGIAG